MKVTSAQAAKIMRKYDDDMRSILGIEEQSRCFIAAVGEDVESVRPVYDYAETQAKLIELEDKIRVIKHALNVFNSTYIISDFGMTIDQILVLMPQLSRRRDKLREMKSVLPKARVDHMRSTSNIIDYRYANYDIAAVEKDYDDISDRLAKLQTALDTVNNTVEFDLEI